MTGWYGKRGTRVNYGGAANRVPIGRRHVTHHFPLPTVPGRYYWTEWKAYVEVFKKKGGRHLYVVPPGKNRLPVRITPLIAGDFNAVSTA